MGGRGNAGARSSGNTTETAQSTTTTPATGTNKQGFEVELGNYPVVQFSDGVWDRMRELRELRHFEDPDLRHLVDNRISDLVDQYDDLERYDADVTNLVEKLDDPSLTNDEYWAAYHVIANQLGIRSPRYIAGENGNDYGYTDTRFGSAEEAADWGHNRDLTHVIDTWTGRYIKIGGKNWRGGR